MTNGELIDILSQYRRDVIIDVYEGEEFKSILVIYERGRYVEINVDDGGVDTYNMEKYE